MTWLPSNMLVGAVEAGGTKWVCAVGSGPNRELLSRVEFPVGDDPTALIAEVIAWLKARETACGRLRAIGIACFGPLDLDTQSPTYGFITTTPKKAWRNFDIVGPFRKAFSRIPVGLDTDVNGAGIGEFVWGHARGLEDFVYVTMGTGIGGGGMARGRILHGLVHPEMGHLLLPTLPGDSFAGACDFHGRCWEGLCSGPAIELRAGARAESLPEDHPAWTWVAQYTAMALANIICVLSPRRIIVGGSVRKAGRLGQDQFFTLVRSFVRDSLNHYIASDELGPDRISRYIVPPMLDDDAGICGAIALGQSAARRPEEATTS